MEVCDWRYVSGRCELKYVGNMEEKLNLNHAGKFKCRKPKIPHFTSKVWKL